MNLLLSTIGIYFFHYCKIIAVSAKLQQRLASVPRDLASDLYEVEQHGAQAHSERQLTRRLRPRHPCKRELPDHPQAVERNGRDRQDEAVRRHASAREKLHAHVALQLAVELLACAVVVVEPHALAHAKRQVRPPAVHFDLRDEQPLPVPVDFPLHALDRHEAAEPLAVRVSGGPSVGADAAEDRLAAARALRPVEVPYAVQQLLGRLPAEVALDNIAHAEILELPYEIACVVARIDADQKLPWRIARPQQDSDAALQELHRAVLAVLPSGTQFGGDHEALHPRVAEDGGVSVDIAVGGADALLVRRLVLEDGDVDVHGKHLHPAYAQRRQAGGGYLRGHAPVHGLDACGGAGRKPVEALAETLLRRDFPTRKLAEEEVVPELLYVGVVASARRLDADEAADYARGRIAGVAGGWQQPVPDGHPLVEVQQPFYERKTAIRVDFFGTLDKFIHDNLIGVWWCYNVAIFVIYCKPMSCQL